eukprot:gnl/MRDRNA2_/MRDRNA2_49945_c0_seq1.p1 gnl/MRDRNA2_/MRDRNA2_49945_c0~~gnl/MRDRNA2_/MRDRNA2_49945_c0_seq1.p1  ORF type:complete len:202 (+),score=37.72 gnl/MRDRNA2_/MRDRNA2_49945_c0_seq1:134-739(+)
MVQQSNSLRVTPGTRRTTKSMTWHPQGRNQGSRQIEFGRDECNEFNDIEKLEMLLLKEELDNAGLNDAKAEVSPQCLILGCPGTYSNEGENGIENLVALIDIDKNKASETGLRTKRSLTWSAKDFWKMHVGETKTTTKSKKKQVLRLSDGMRYDLAQSIAARVQLSISSDERKTIQSIERTHFSNVTENRDSDSEEEDDED